MGGRNSTFQDRSFSRGQSWNQNSNNYRNYPPQSPTSTQSYDSRSYSNNYVYQPPPPPSQQPQTNAPRPQRRLDRRYSQIADNYRSLEQVTEALAQAGLESSNLSVGIDFTKSNEWTGNIHSITTACTTLVMFIIPTSKQSPSLGERFQHLMKMT